MNVYTYGGSMYCEGCVKKLKDDIGSEPAAFSRERPQGPFPKGGGKADSPQHCSDCGIFLENPLTDVGYDYIYGLAIDDLTDTVKEWLAFYGISDVVSDESWNEIADIDEDFAIDDDIRDDPDCDLADDPDYEKYDDDDDDFVDGEFD